MFIVVHRELPEKCGFFLETNQPEYSILENHIGSTLFSVFDPCIQKNVYIYNAVPYYNYCQRRSSAAFKLN